MSNRPIDAPPHPAAVDPRWSDIELDAIDAPALARQPRLFDLVVAASFVEISAEHYTANLASHFAGHDEATRWLTATWRPEEIGHGRILRAYARRAWPDFDWEGAYADFFAEYSAACSHEELEPSRALEMAARCVVEMGTTTFYRMLAEYAREPVLVEIANRIRRDEARHYKHFRQYFVGLNRGEGNGRWQIIQALRTRLGEADTDDAWYAIKHVHRHRYGRAPEPDEYRRLRREVRGIFRRHYPYGQAARMLLHLLDLPGRWRRPAERLLTPAMRLVILR